MSTQNTVYISNLSYKRDRNGVKSLFQSFGQILNIKIVVEPTTNQSRGMAFVEMSSLAEAQEAIKGLNGRSIDGRTVKLKPATPMKSSSTPFKEPFFVGKMLEQQNAQKTQKDLKYVTTQLAKKARNDAKRNSNPLQFKVATKKK